MFWKAVTATALSFLLSNFGRIDDWSATPIFFYSAFISGNWILLTFLLQDTPRRSFFRNHLRISHLPVLAVARQLIVIQGWSEARRYHACAASGWSVQVPTYFCCFHACTQLFGLSLWTSAWVVGNGRLCLIKARVSFLQNTLILEIVEEAVCYVWKLDVYQLLIDLCMYSRVYIKW